MGSCLILFTSTSHVIGCEDRVFAPVKWLARKIVSEMSCNVLNGTSFICLSQTCLSSCYWHIDRSCDLSIGRLNLTGYQSRSPLTFVLSQKCLLWWCSGRASDSQLRGHGFNSRSGTAIATTVHTLVPQSPSSISLYYCKSREDNGRLWKRCGLPSITLSVSSLPD